MSNNNSSTSATGSVKVDIDSDDDSTNQVFGVRSNNGSTPVMKITEGGALVASGKGDFSTGGVRLAVLSSAPSGGESGDIHLYENGDDLRIYVNFAGFIHDIPPFRW